MVRCIHNQEIEAIYVRPLPKLFYSVPALLALVFSIAAVLASFFSIALILDSSYVYTQAFLTLALFALPASLSVWFNIYYRRRIAKSEPLKWQALLGQAVLGVWGIALLSWSDAGRGFQIRGGWLSLFYASLGALLFLSIHYWLSHSAMARPGSARRSPSR